MEREVWTSIVTQLDALRKPAPNRRYTFSDEQVVLVLLWAALHERPVYWACHAASWPADSCPPRLPTPATMSRRLRRPAVIRLLQRLEQRARGRQRLGCLYIVDGKALPIGGHSNDPDAGFGRGAGVMAKGYKLHVIAGVRQDIRAWCVRPIQVDEAKTAAELLKQTTMSGYLLADANYDRNTLYDACRRRGLQLLAPRRYGPHRGLGHHPHSPARLRAIELLEQSATNFAPTLHTERRRIEQLFGSLSASSFGLPSLPPWIRTLPRVQRWITAKLVIWHTAKRIRNRTG